MQFTASANGAIIRVDLVGRVTYADHNCFRDVIAFINESGGIHSVEFDLSQVNFIDSSGLGMLLLVRDAAQEHNATVVLIGAQGQTQRIIESCKFDSLFTIQG